MQQKNKSYQELQRRYSSHGHRWLRATITSDPEVDGSPAKKKSDRQTIHTQREDNPNEIGEGDTEPTFTASPPEKSIFRPTDIWYHLRSDKTKEEILQKLEKDIIPNFTGPWGDNLEEQDVTHFRVYFQNVRGLNFDKEGNEFRITFDNLRETNADFYGLVETNMDWGQRNVLGVAHRRAKQTFHHTSIQTSASTIRLTHAHKRGGTLSMAVGATTSQIIRKGEDPMGLGRWSWVQLRSKHNQSLYIITAYQVSQKTTKNLGHRTAAYQQVMLLTEQCQDPDADIAPRRQLIEDLTGQILQWQEEQKSEILLMIDANENLEDGSLIGVLSSTCQLQDLHEVVHPDTIESAPPSHNTGSTRIDYLLGSPNVVSAAVRAGITDFHDIIPSDHRGLFVDLDR